MEESRENSYNKGIKFRAKEDLPMEEKVLSRKEKKIAKEVKKKRKKSSRRREQ